MKSSPLEKEVTPRLSEVKLLKEMVLHSKSFLMNLRFTPLKPLTIKLISTSSLGFSNCLKHHQSESARFGWRWYQDELQILGYVYTDSDLHFELLGSIPFNTEVNLRVDIEDNGYRFSGDGLTETVIPRSSEGCEAGANYWLWPYFGGDETPSHDIVIKLERETL